MDRWQGRVAIVTGTNSGIGQAIARLLVQNGMRVVDLRLERVQALVGEMKGCKGELHAIQGDVRNEEDVVRVVKWTRDNLGGADVLVNSAGVGGISLLTELDTEVIRKIFDTNVFGLSLFTREVIKDMRERGVDDGHIFHLCSLAGQVMVDVPGSYLYAASKHAVRVLTEGLRRELRDLKTKIRITSISPGIVRTDFALSRGLTEEQARQHYDSSPCLEAKDIADALLYALATPPHVQVHEITILPTGQLF